MDGRGEVAEGYETVGEGLAVEEGCLENEEDFCLGEGLAEAGEAASGKLRAGRGGSGLNLLAGDGGLRGLGLTVGDCGAG